MVLGAKIPNPYEISVMRQAFRNLKSAGKFKGNLSQLSEEDLMPTDSYEQYLPSSHDDADQMRADTSLLFFDFPLDYEIVEDGTYYHDPSIPAEEPSFLYAVQPKQRPIRLTARARMELLADLYIPEHDPEFGYRYKSTGGDVDFAATLEQEAMRLVGLPVEPSGKTGLPSTTSRWNPSGSVRIREANTNITSPMPGVKVVFFKFLRVSSAKTKADGTFLFDGGFVNAGFTKEVRYRIKWETDEFDLRDGEYGQAYSGKSGKMQGAWNKVVEPSNSKEYFHANVFRAAHFYWFEQGEVTRPTRKTLTNRKVKMQLFNSNASKNQGEFVYDATTKIRKYLSFFSHNNVGQKIANRDLISVVLHEIAHASHHNKNNKHFDESTNRITESWATFCEWRLTELFYKNLLVKSNGLRTLEEFYFSESANYESSGRQNITKFTTDGQKLITAGYTPYFVDIFDTNKQNSYTDNVNNLFNSAELEILVTNAKDFMSDSFQNEVKNQAIKKAQSAQYSDYLYSFKNNTGY
jgi:hypothetical protein